MRKAPLLTTLLFGLLVVGCGKQSAGIADGTLQIVTTTGMITDIVGRVGGERVSVHGLMGPGVDPHLYKASEGDVGRMVEADIIFYNGLHLEGAMGEVFDKMDGRIRTVAVTEGIDDSLLLSPAEFEGAHDPHVWFDVSLWMEAVKVVRRTLIATDSTYREQFNANADSLMLELEELHQYVAAQAARVPEDRRVLITAHDAFNYFGRAYGFEVRGLQGISTAAEAGTADVQSLSTFIAEREIPAIFVESSVPPRTVEAV
ncbi:MAG: zinc ABC transporter solute-binding protein, partial [bacterium]|nr:zinc ABC transporter solute-binding protein [bacterium]